MRQGSSVGLMSGCGPNINLWHELATLILVDTLPAILLLPGALVLEVK
jgi:hypothetical protein